MWRRINQVTNNKNKNKDSSMNTTIISSSLRKTSSSNKLAFYINLRGEHIEALNLKENRNVEVTKNGDRYKVRFLAKPTARSRALQFKTDQGASVYFAPELFKLNHTEQVAAFRMEAEYVENSIEFLFDQEEFFKPRATVAETKKITTPEEKAAATFKVDTAWAVKVQAEIDEKIDALIASSMKKKFEGR